MFDGYFDSWLIENNRIYVSVPADSPLKWGGIHVFPLAHNSPRKVCDTEGVRLF
jgi:hypothetical protein